MNRIVDRLIVSAIVLVALALPEAARLEQGLLLAAIGALLVAGILS